MRRLAPLAAILAAALLLGAAAPNRLPFRDWKDPDLGAWIVEGAATGRQLWLRGQTGVVVEVDRANGDRRVAARGVRGMLMLGSSLWVLQTEDGRAVLRDLRRPGAAPIDSPVPDGMLLAAGDRLAVLGAEALHVRDGPAWTRTTVAFGEPAGAPVVAADRRGRVYLGEDKGEWGGGLRMFDPAADAVFQVEDEHGDELCAGMLNPACDPVSGIIPAPDDPDCVIVATGLAHLSLSEGYILRVCGRTVTKLFSDPIRKSDRPQAGFPGSRAFSQLQPLAGGWAAVAGYSLYRSRDGVVGRSALPKLSGRNGIYFGDVGPDLVVVMSQCCFGWVDDPAEYQVLLVPVSAD